MECALGHGTVAEEAAHHLGLFAVIDRKSQSGCDRQTAAHDCVAAHEAQHRVEQMHRAPAPLGDSRCLAEQLRHHRPRRSALGQAMAMFAVGRDHVVLVVQAMDGPDCDRFLTGVEMAEAGDLAAGVHLGHFVLETPDQNHAPVQVQQLVFRQFVQSPLGNSFAFKRHIRFPSRTLYRDPAPKVGGDG